jgi:hypothetical protein
LTCQKYQACILFFWAPPTWSRLTNFIPL